MTADGDDLRVADRDPADMIDRHRLLVIGQRVGRRIATSRRWQTSARTFARERSTHSSIFSANASTRGRDRTDTGNPPPASSRARTQCATVL